MKFYVISDNVDVLLGMRMSGIEGVLAFNAKDANEALDKICAREDIAVVMMTERLSEWLKARVYDLKLNHRRPLVVEIPNRDGSGGGMGAISRYVEEAIGIKL